MPQVGEFERTRFARQRVQACEHERADASDDRSYRHRAEIRYSVATNLAMRNASERKLSLGKSCTSTRRSRRTGPFISVLPIPLNSAVSTEQRVARHHNPCARLEQLIVSRHSEQLLNPEPFSTNLRGLGPHPAQKL